MYPWQQELTALTQARQYTVFLLHGAIRDRIRLPDHNYGTLGESLQKDLFQKKDYFIEYDPARGIDFPNKEQKKEFNRTLGAYDSIHGTNYASNVPRSPGGAFLLLENFARLQAMQNKSAVIVIDYLEDILPQSDRGFLSNELRYCLVALDRWARDPFFLRKDVAFILTVENLASLETKITRNNAIPKLELLLPDKDERLAFLKEQDQEVAQTLELGPEAAAGLSAGMSLSGMERLLQYAHKNNKPITTELISEKKKEMIEAECYGLLEFVEPKTGLDHVAGHEAAKEKFRQAATAIKQGKTEILPMGYLICGPVGTGKTFMVTSFAGEIGVPVVQIRNFRSQWVGATEGNLEKILNLLKSMWPVAVIVDEADAFLGDREQSGDSGTGARVFARLMNFMGNTEYRGKIIWFLITARPDLLPIDIKRQGRAEEHFALFYPHSNEDKEALYRAMCKKLGLGIGQTIAYKDVFPKDRTYSGADMEAVLIRSRFLEFTKSGGDEPSADTIREVVADFIPPTYPNEVELQNLVAVRECTSRRMVPERYQKIEAADLHGRISDLLRIVG